MKHERNSETRESRGGGNTRGGGATKVRAGAVKTVKKGSDVAPTAGEEVTGRGRPKATR